jgi:hypothetical protein
MDSIRQREYKENIVPIVIILISLVWLATVVVVLAACRMAARGDAAPIADPPQSPRRPTTWDTVRSRILTSPQSDQLAT